MPSPIAIIPARLASSRFPKKVLTDILGKSLLRRTYDQVCQCKELKSVFIACDDPLVRQHAEDFGATVIMTDPKLPSGTHRVAEALAHIQSDAQIILNVQADEPCFDPALATTLIRTLQDHPSARVATPISQIKNPEHIFDPSIVKCVFDQLGRALYFSRAPIPYPQHPKKVQGYYRHLGVYCFKREALFEYVNLDLTPLQCAEDLEQLKLLEWGIPINVCIVKSESIEVNTPEDVAKVEAFLCQQAENISL